MQRVVVQVPMDKDLKEKAEIASSDMGFSSLQEVVRVLLTKVSKRELNLRVEEVEEVTYLSPAAEKRFKKAVEDIKTGRNITKTKSVDERVRKFSENPNDPLLKDHALSGKLKGFRAFSVTGNARVIYYIHEGVAYLLDIVTHNQV